jgi:hypothetical protein
MLGGGAHPAPFYPAHAPVLAWLAAGLRAPRCRAPPSRSRCRSSRLGNVALALRCSRPVALAWFL